MREFVARRPVAQRPERPTHSVEEKRQDITRLERRIDELEAFDPNGVTARFTDPSVKQIETAISSTLAAVFGQRTDEYNRYIRATHLDHGTISVSSSWTDSRRGGYRDEAAEARQYVTEGKAEALVLLRQAVQTLQEEIEFAPSTPVARTSSRGVAQLANARKVFIVHGHDDGAREIVARYLGKIDFEPIILNEQPNKGRTVIEKVEANSDVGFAVVLLTPDDEGSKRGEAKELRARQNVLLELGYFIGKLGRERVCALRRGEVSIPSDFAGVLWESMDEQGGWKSALARELQAAGLDVDWNKVMRL